MEFISQVLNIKEHKYYLRYLCFLYGLLLLWSCTPKGNQLDCPENQGTHILGLVDSISFRLDTNSNPERMNYVYSEVNDQGYFYFHNPFEHSIYLYNYDQKELLEIIKLFSDGPNAISRNIGGVYVIDLNKIAITELATGFLKIIDREGEIQKKMRIFQEDDFRNRASPNSNLSRPIIYHENRLYIIGLALGVEPIADHTNFMNAYEVNVVDDKVNVFLPRPPVYNDGQYGLLALYQIYCTENIDRTGIIYGFGLTPNIYEMKYGDTKQLEPHCLKSDFINEIKPYEANRDNWHYDDGKMMVYDQNISYYANIYSLPKTRHYVRFNSIGPNFEGGTFRKNSISLFDEDFNKLGEVSIRQKIRYGYRIFSNKRGLHLMKEEQDEDILTFYIYNVVEQN